MGVVQLPDDLKQVIDRQIAEGRASSEAEFLTQAVESYARTLEQQEDEILAAADEGTADIEAGRFEVLSGTEDIQRLRLELQEKILEGSSRGEPTGR